MKIGSLILGLLVLHTGFESGDNLNRYLLMNFLALTAAGAAAGLVLSAEKKLAMRWGKRFRSWSNWTHLLLSWPLPALLTFHIVSVYYF